VQPDGRAAMAVQAASDGKPKALRDSLPARSASAEQGDGSGVAEASEKEAKRCR